MLNACWWPRTLVLQLTVFVASLLILTCGGMGWLGYSSARNLVLEQVRDGLSTVASAQQALLVGYLQDYEHVVEVLTGDGRLNSALSDLAAGRVGEEGFRKTARTILTDEQRDMAGILAILIADRKGRVLTSTDPNYLGRNFGGHPGFVKGLQEIHVSEPILAGRKYQAFAAGPIRTKDSAPSGVVIVFFDWTALVRYMGNPERLGMTGEILLAVRRGQAVDYLLPTREGKTVSGIALATDGAARAALTGRKGLLRCRDYRGEEVLAAYRPVGRTEWGLVAKMDVDEANERVRRLRRDLLASTLLLLACGVGAAYVLAHRFVRPILILARHAEQVAAGDLAVRATVGGRNEIGLLATCFNRMAESLAQSYATLEQKVSTRTRELDRARTLLESILHCMGAGVVVADGDGSILLSNPQAERLTGRCVPPVSTPSWSQRMGFYTPDKQTFWDDDRFPLQRAVRGESVNATEVFVRNDAVSEGAWLSVVARPLKAQDGALQGAVVVLHDITDRKRSEEHLRRSEERLRLASKMEAVGTIAAGIAHHFNNMLQIMLGHSENLNDSLCQDDPRCESIEIIQSTGHRAVELVRQLLHFSRRQPSRAEVVDLSLVVTETMKMLRSVMPETIRLEVELPAQPAPVVADPRELEEILVNLSLNARDAMPRGGSLTMRVQEQSTSRMLDHLTSPVALDGPSGEPQESRRQVVLTVEDTGIGMEATIRERVFEPFFTTKGPDRGTGLGLSIVYGIVRRCEGTLQVSSESGRGTSFSISLPRAEHSLAPSTPSIDRDSQDLTTTQGGRETILVVEDEALLRELIADHLTQKGYTILEAVDGQEALAAAEAWGDGIHLLLTDLFIPGCNGRELSNQLQERQPSLKVLYMSAHGEDEIRGLGGELCAVCIRKPFSMTNLLRRVRAELDGRALHGDSDPKGPGEVI